MIHGLLFFDDAEDDARESLHRRTPMPYRIEFEGSKEAVRQIIKMLDDLFDQGVELKIIEFNRYRNLDEEHGPEAERAKETDGRGDQSVARQGALINGVLSQCLTMTRISPAMTTSIA
jgi:hypothetical protein